MNTDQIGHNLRALYLHPNPFQLWAWVLSVLALLFVIKPTRRFGGFGFLIALGCMALYFGMMSVFKDYAPTGPDLRDLEKARAH